MNKGHNPASGRLQSSKGGIACPGGTVVKNLPANAGASSKFLDSEDPWMATHSSILAWRIPWRAEPGRLQSIESQRVGHD